MGSVILYIFMTTAVSKSGYAYNSWVQQGQYKNLEACEKAIIRLNIPDTGRCVYTY